MALLLVGTRDGVWVVEHDDRSSGNNTAVPSAFLRGRTITALAAAGDTLRVLADGNEVLAFTGAWTASSGFSTKPSDVGGNVSGSAPTDVGTPRVLARLGGDGGRGDRDVAVLATTMHVQGTDLYVGTTQAHLRHASLASPGGEVELVPVDGFEAAPGRAEWYTPWGGPADVRSIAGADDGTLLVNIHVGGVTRSTDGARTWTPVIDIDTDVHQVIVLDDGRYAVATGACGYAESRDAGATWRYGDAGLHGSYLRALAVAGDHLVVTASTGPHATRAAVYRRPLSADVDAPFERCTDGLPEMFAHNIDTHWLTATADGHAAFATQEGDVYHSADEGRHWTRSRPDSPSPARSCWCRPPRRVRPLRRDRGLRRR